MHVRHMTPHAQWTNDSWRPWQPLKGIPKENIYGREFLWWHCMHNRKHIWSRVFVMTLPAQWTFLWGMWGIWHRMHERFVTTLAAFKGNTPRKHKWSRVVLPHHYKNICTLKGGFITKQFQRFDIRISSRIRSRIHKGFRFFMQKPKVENLVTLLL
jgi:hypothetical protein